MPLEIDLSPNGFAVKIPSALNNGQTHEIQIPATEAGIKILHKVLSERKRSFARFEIGNDTSPTQHQVEAWLTEDRRRRALEKAAAEAEKEEKRTAEAKALFGGLDLGDIDI